jgi:hypothetical protein
MLFLHIFEAGTHGYGWVGLGCVDAASEPCGLSTRTDAWRRGTAFRFRGGNRLHEAKRGGGADLSGRVCADQPRAASGPARRRHG